MFLCVGARTVHRSFLHLLTIEFFQLHTKDKWIQKGLVVRENEEPIKRVLKRNMARRGTKAKMEAEEEVSSFPLFADDDDENEKGSARTWTTNIVSPIQLVIEGTKSDMSDILSLSLSLSVYVCMLSVLSALCSLLSCTHQMRIYLLDKTDDDRNSVALYGKWQTDSFKPQIASNVPPPI